MSDTEIKSAVTTMPAPVPLAEEPEEEAVRTPVRELPEVTYDDVAADEEAGEKERAAAFQHCPAWRFNNGQVRELVLSISREAFFEQFRVAVGAPDWKLINYDSWLPDAFRLLFLCLVEPAEYRHLISEPVALQEVVEAWAEENIGRERAAEAADVAWKLWIHRNDNLPEMIEGGAGGSEPGN